MSNNKTLSQFQPVGDGGKVDTSQISENVVKAPYYHGLMPRYDIEPMLTSEGDFLLRKTEIHGSIVLALAVKWEGKVKHFVVNHSEKSTFYFENHHEKSVGDLVNWHVKNKVPVSSLSGAKLVKAIDRPIWVLNHDCIKTIRKLGEGAFGEVYMADLTSEKGNSLVAVKTMREEISREARLKFMKEARLMRKFDHKHVVRILGVAVHEHPIMLIMELCLGGSVLTYLRKHKGKLTLETKLRFVVEASSGLAYLEEKGCIHRDIAARNCLLTKEQTVKISDFGMSDEKAQITDNNLDKVPVKWLAPETMQTKVYSTKTDVWSFAIMSWEIYAEGGEPYPGLSNVQTRAKIVVHDYRMEFPRDIPANVGALIAECWHKEPTKRPSFLRIHESLNKEYKNTFGEREDREEGGHGHSEKELTKKERKKTR